MWLKKKCSGALVPLAARHRDGDLLPALRTARVAVLVRADERVSLDLDAVDLDGGERVRRGSERSDGAPVALVGLTGALLREHGPPSPAGVDRLVHVEPVRAVADLASEVVEQDRAAAVGHHDVDLLDRVVEADCCVLLVELAVLVGAAVVCVARVGRATRTAAAAGPGRAAASRASARSAAARRAAGAGVARGLALVDGARAAAGAGVLADVDALLGRTIAVADRAAVDDIALVGVAAGATAAARAGGRATGAGCARHAGGRSLVAVLRPTDASDGGEGDEHERNEGDEGELVHGNTRFLILGFGNVLIGDDACASDSDSPTSGYLT